jgi:rhomboid family GlyGly-CTERM serine protease
MIAKAIRSSVGVWRWPAALGLFSAALLFLPPAIIDQLRYDRAAVAAGQWWRLLSGNMVHLGFWHYSLNAASLVLLVALCPERIPGWDWLARIVFVSFGTCLGMYWGAPWITAYVGLSGMIYGLFFLGLGSQAWSGDRFAWMCLVFLAGRIGFEFIVGIPPSEEHLVGGRIVPESHLYGVIAAFVYAVVRTAALRLSTIRRRDAH